MRFAREKVREERERAYSPAERAERFYLARISALVAAHVVGLTLTRTGSDVYPWRQIDAGGKIRELGNYTGDFGAISGAEARLDEPDREAHRARYAKCLAETLGFDAFLIARASPFARAVALLAAFKVPVGSEPPTVDG